MTDDIKDAREKLLKLNADIEERKEYLRSRYWTNKNIRNVLLSTSLVKNKEGQLISVLGTANDVTELRNLEQKLVQADRLASIGQLVAGIAHEINNPIGVIYLYSTESMKLFERVTNALKLISSIPISENTRRLNDVVTSIDRKTNAELEKDALRKELYVSLMIWTNTARNWRKYIMLLGSPDPICMNT